MTPKDMARLVAEIRDILDQKSPPYHSVLKWNRNQPRGPKGSPTGGRWVAGVSAGGGTASSTFKPPEYGFGSTEDRRRAQANQASYAAIMNAPTGTGFHNRPRGVGIPEPKAEPTGDPKILSALKEGTVTDSRPLGGGGTNASVIVTMDDGTEAVYKPERGERWGEGFANHEITDYITNKDFSLAAREAFAFEVDTALSLGIVPETVLREQVDETHISVDTSGDGSGGGGYDEDYAREEYEKYKEKMIDDDSIMDEVGQRFEAKFDEAKNDHVSDLESRREELQEIWDELVKDYPEDTTYGAQSELRKHPVLPMGSVEGFERREKKLLDEVNPIALLDEAKVDVSATMSDEEEDRVRAAMRGYLDEGYRRLGEVDEHEAKEHLDRDDWYQEHENTEAEIRDSVYGDKVQSFTAWRKSQGYRSDGSYGGGGGGDQNPDAPHPNGGSFQNFRSNAEGWGNMSAEDGAKLAVLDYVIGTMDRHGANLMFENDRPVAIDNGYSMPGGMDTEDDFQFRSEGVNEWYRSSKSRNVPSELRAQLHEAMEQTDWDALVARHPGMSAEEKEAFLGRVNNLTIALQTEEGLRELWRKQRRM